MNKSNLFIYDIIDFYLNSQQCNWNIQPTPFYWRLRELKLF